MLFEKRLKRLSREHTAAVWRKQAGTRRGLNLASEKTGSDACEQSGPLMKASPTEEKSGSEGRHYKAGLKPGVCRDKPRRISPIARCA
jgi:hypothetical protein